MMFLYLHSTMYLLNPAQADTDIECIQLFTFHYVSIKSLILFSQDT